MIELSDKALNICMKHCDDMCKDCPLKSPCAMKAGDDQEIHAKRVNEAAELLP